jgi:hypothetical protein
MDALTAPRIAARSQPEIVIAIAQLTAGEKIALMKIARLYARRTPYDHEDLIHEAIARMLSGRRTWPRHINATMFMGGVIRSIAWEWRVARPSDEPGLTDVTCEERNANAAIDAAKIIALFDNDVVARRIVIAMMDGAKGEELQAISELSKTEYESKRTKIRRRIGKFMDAQR